MAPSSRRVEVPAAYRSWIPRLTSNVMVDLRLWMIGFGLLIGVLFPFVMVALGVPRDPALRPGFFAATLVAGLLVAEVNHGLARAVVGRRLRALSSWMGRVTSALEEAAYCYSRTWPTGQSSGFAITDVSCGSPRGWGPGGPLRC